MKNQNSPKPELTSVGTATMLPNGSLVLNLHTNDNGRTGSAQLVIGKDDERYARYIKHVGAMQPGDSKNIPPFPSGF